MYVESVVGESGTVNIPTMEYVTLPDQDNTIAKMYIVDEEKGDTHQVEDDRGQNPR